MQNFRLDHSGSEPFVSMHASVCVSECVCVSVCVYVCKCAIINLAPQGGDKAKYSVWDETISPLHF